MRIFKRSAGWGALAGALAVLAGCGVTDPQRVGNGAYLQITEGETVLVESDASNAGFQNCRDAAYQLLETQPSLAGSVKCAEDKTHQPMRYHFRAQEIRSADGGRISPGAPYTVRTLTAARCKSMLAGVRKREKTRILEARCA